MSPRASSGWKDWNQVSIKGKELIQGKRLLFQIEFANSMFGQSYPPIDINIDSEAHQDIYSKYIDTYGEILQLANV